MSAEDLEQYENRMELELYREYKLSLIHISEPTRRLSRSRMPSSA